LNFLKIKAYAKFLPKTNASAAFAPADAPLHLARCSTASIERIACASLIDKFLKPPA
jgi:hypothetical protein